MITYTNEEGVRQGVTPFTHGSRAYTDIMKTEALRQALDRFGFDMVFGGARREEEKSRAKERVFSFVRADALVASRGHGIRLAPGTAAGEAGQVHRPFRFPVQYVIKAACTGDSWQRGSIPNSGRAGAGSCAPMPGPWSQAGWQSATGW